MPQTSRAADREAKQLLRAQEKEAKRARGAMSCAECRRLKLKCDKTVPCSSCRRRGCAAICPNGSLVTGQGTRFVLADTEVLHKKITQMSDRIRQLEDALAILQRALTSEPHHLLHRDLLDIKSIIELHSASDADAVSQVKEEVEDSQYIDAFGTLAIRDDGASTFYGRSAGHESLLLGEPSLGSGHEQDYHPYSELPSSVHNLADSFPFSYSEYAGGEWDVISLAQEFLPQWENAWHFCELYLEQAPWFFGAVCRKQLIEEILPLWYPEAASNLPSPPTSSTDYYGKGGAHELALLFVILCFGALTDIKRRPPPDNLDAERYYKLTRASLTLEPVCDRPPSVATVQTLSLMAIYQGLCSGENSIESTWSLMGLATKLAQSIGLHRDSARWNLSPTEVQKRRALFHELFITDCWQSLATGRLPTFSLPFVDCELPMDPDETLDGDGNPQPSFPAWKARFGIECVSYVVQDTLASRVPKYSDILELDRKIRDMPLPKYTQRDPPANAGLSQAMSYYMPKNYRELTLIYVHRCFFADAISTHASNPLASKYAPSFLAGYHSACEFLESVRAQFLLFPEQIARFWVLWTHGFSAAVMLSAVVTHASKSKVAPAALVELTKACELFQNAAKHGGRAVKFLPIIERLKLKAQETYKAFRKGVSSPTRGDIFTPSRTDGEQDELSIFSGRTHTKMVVSPPRHSPSQSSSQKSNSSRNSPQHQTSSQPGSAHGQHGTPPHSFTGVHPALVDQLYGFEGHIDAQLSNAADYQDIFAFSAPGPSNQPQYHHPPPQSSYQPMHITEHHQQESAYMPNPSYEPRGGNLVPTQMYDYQHQHQHHQHQHQHQEIGMPPGGSSSTQYYPTPTPSTAYGSSWGDSTQYRGPQSNAGMPAHAAQVQGGHEMTVPAHMQGVEMYRPIHGDGHNLQESWMTFFDRAASP